MRKTKMKFRTFEILMRNQQRFEEAFRKLQLEVQGKTKKCIEARMTPSQLIKPKTGPLDVFPVQLSNQIDLTQRVPIAKVPRNYYNTIARIHSPEPPKSARISHRNAPRFKMPVIKERDDSQVVTAKPVLSWDTREILDYKVFEEALASTVKRLNTIAEPQSFRSGNLQSHMFPIDYFDPVIDMTQEECDLRENYIPCEGMAYLDGLNGVKEWIPVKIIRYNIDTCDFQIESMDEKPFTRHISRFCILFPNDDPDVLAIRAATAEKMRNQFEREMRTMTFLDSLPNPADLFDFIRPKIRKMMSEDALEEAARAQKMQILRGEFKLGQKSNLKNLMEQIGADMNLYNPEILKNPIVVDTQFKSSFKLLSQQTNFIASEKYLNALQTYNNLLIKTKETIFDYTKDFFDGCLKSVEEWSFLVKPYTEKIHNILIELSDNISLAFGRAMEDSLDFTNRENFKDITIEHPPLVFFEESHPIFTRMKNLLFHRLYFFASECIEENMHYFIDLIDYPFNVDLIEDTSSDIGFVTLTQTVSDKSISSKKPFISIRLETTREDLKNTIKAFFLTISSELETITSPFRITFEGHPASIVSTIQQSRFEAFILDNHLLEYVPSRELFSRAELSPIAEGAFEVFEKRLDKALDQIYSVYPKLKEASDSVITYFTRSDVPPIEDTRYYIHELEEQKFFYMKNFPYQIWLSFAQLIFDDKRELVSNLVKSHREHILSQIMYSVHQMLDELHQSYTELNERLTQKIQTPSSWVTIKNSVLESPKIRKELDFKSSEITKLANILESLYFGLDSEYLTKSLNQMMWPVLTDIQLGKTIALLQRTGSQLVATVPEELRKLQEKIEGHKRMFDEAKETNVKIQHQEFIDHIKGRINHLNEIVKEFDDIKFSQFNQPRVRLWIIVTTSQHQISIWNETEMRDMDFNKAKEMSMDWLKQLRLLTQSLKKDKPSLRLLISAKNDIELLLPVFKGCTQSLTPKLLANHMPEIVEIMGREDFQTIKIGQLMSEYKLAEKIPSIERLYRQTKLEDKADYEIISVQTIVKTIEFNVTKGGLVGNIMEIQTKVRECRNNMMMIASTEGIEENKRVISNRLIKSLKKYAQLCDLLDVIQGLLRTLRPVVSVKDLAMDISDLKSASSEYNSMINEIKANPKIYDFISKEIHNEKLQDIRVRLRKLNAEFIQALAAYRQKVPRLLLIPDVQIVNIFADNNESKLAILPLLFPGVREFISDENNKIISFKLDFDDHFELKTPIDLREEVLSIISKIETLIVESLKECFFDAVEGRKEPSDLPLQLLILYIMYKPDAYINSTGYPFIKRRAVEMFQSACQNAKTSPRAIISDDKEVFIVTSDTHKIKYGFQVVETNSVMYTDVLFGIIYDLISNVGSEPILIMSDIGSTSSLIAQQLAYLVGRHCTIIHATQTTSIHRLANIIPALDSIDIWTCLTDTELLSDSQMFELTMLIHMPYFLTVTTSNILPVLTVGKVMFSISNEAFIGHVAAVGNTAYPYQPEAIKFATETLSQYSHPYFILNVIQDQMKAENVTFDLNFLANIKATIPENVYNIVSESVDESVEPDKVFVHIVKSMLSTTDFLNGVHMIVNQLMNGKQILLVTGPRFSGTSTCIRAAADALNLPYKSMAFESQNWIKELNETLAHEDNDHCCFHVMAPFNDAFLAHVSALGFGSSICEGENSLLQIPKRTTLIFEVLTPLTNPELVGIPVLAFSQPLVRSGDLLNYWLSNINVQIPQEFIHRIRELVSILITDSLQLSIFFDLFTAFIKLYETPKVQVLDSFILFCAFWSRAHDLETLQDWKDYSDSLKIKSGQKSKGDAIYECMIVPQMGQFALHNTYSNTLTYQFDQNLNTKFSHDVCGPQPYTNVPTPALIHAIEIIVPIVESKRNVAIIGPPSTGKSTVLNYIVSRYFKHPKFAHVRLNGETTTPEEFLKALLHVCTISLESVVEPRDAGTILVSVDPFGETCKLFGTILSIIKTRNAVIGKQIITLKNVSFILVVEKDIYQVSSCCFPYRMQPYSDIDLRFLGTEIMLRTMITINAQKAQIIHAQQLLSQAMPEIIRVCRLPEAKFLHTFCQAIRSLQLVNPLVSLNYSDFIMSQLREFVPKADIPPVGTQFELELGSDDQTSEKVFRYVQKERESKFREEIAPHAHLFSFKVKINPPMLRFTQFIMDLIKTPYANAIVVNDLNIDYECITRFAASILSSKFVVYNSLQQLEGLFYDSILSNQQMIVYCRFIDLNLLQLLTGGLKSIQAPLLQKIIGDESFGPDNGVGNQYPYANLALTLEEHKRKRDFFPYFVLHMFENTHFVFSVTELSEIEERLRRPFFEWDKHEAVPETEDKLVNLFLNTIVDISNESYVDSIAQFPKLIKIHTYLLNRVKGFVQQRQVFLQDVRIVTTSIMSALNDTDKRADELREQIKLDEKMRESAIKSTENARRVVVDFTGEVVRVQQEYEVVVQQYNQILEYMDKDGAKTLEAYKKITRIAQKAFTADEQYKLYSQQRPNESIQTVFAAYCTLMQLTPRDGLDYWPEARGFLKSGRLPQALGIFDPSEVNQETIEKFDVAIAKVDPSAFKEGSCCHFLARWLKAVHDHTKRTSFNAAVNPKISELLMMKSKKEDELNAVKERLESAISDKNAAEKALQSISDKINEEKNLLENILLFYNIAKRLSGVFPELDSELERFQSGERSYGKNIEGFVLKSVIDTVARPLYSPSTVKKLDALTSDMFNVNSIETTYFVELKDILSTTDPLVVSLLADDRIIAVFDPHEVASSVMGFETHKPHQVLAHLDFVYTDPLRDSFVDDVTNASTNGHVLIIKHADSVIKSKFFVAASNESITSAILDVNSVPIDPEFRAVLLCDSPPQTLPPRMSFIAETTMDQSRFEALLAGDAQLADLAERQRVAEMSLIQQRENLLACLQGIRPHLKEVHSTRADLLREPEFQGQLLTNASAAYKDITMLKEHALDGQQWIKDSAARLVELVDRLQSMHKYSPMYLFPFSKLEAIVRSWDKKSDLFEHVYSHIASMILKRHRRHLEELKGVKPVPIDPSRFNIVHSADYSVTARFFVHKRVPDSSHLFVDSSTDPKKLGGDISKRIENGTCVVSFFAPNNEAMRVVSKFVSDNPPDTWKEGSRMFLHASTDFRLPPQLLYAASVFALD